jgi:adenosine deaminase
MVDAFSMRWFLPTPAVPTGHDEFFAAFEKFGTVSGSHFVDMTVDQLKLYDSQNVQYVEFMVSSWCPNDRERNALRKCAQGFTLSNRRLGAY